MNLKASFVSHLKHKYPNLDQAALEPLIADNLLSPFQVPISIQLVESIRSEIKKYWKLREWGAVHLHEQFEKMGLRKPKNFGVCMSYDFHVNSTNQLDLIEINTNASFLALGHELYQMLRLSDPASGFTDEKLIEMFQKENKLSSDKKLSVAIVDENPSQQRLYVEFLIYQSLFQKANIACEIANISEFEKMKSSSLVYNRYTDFFLETSISSDIKNLYNAGEIQLSPNPYEYFLLADKQRMIDWSMQDEVEKPTSLLKTLDLGKENPEQVWADRKSLFFKPKNAYGGKQTYKGASISKKIFDEVSNSHFIAQKASPAPEIEVDFKGEKTKFKYDLRCYAYQDELQLIIARLYQGQTTNLRTEGGGFACVVIA